MKQVSSPPTQNHTRGATSIRQSRAKLISRRRGSSLIEMTSLMVIIATIVSLSSVALTQAFRAHRNGLLHLQTLESLRSLGERFRSDSQAALSAIVEPIPSKDNAAPAQQLRLNLPDGRTIVYRPVQAQCVRTVYTAGNPQAAGQNVWELGEESSLAWRLITTETLPLVSMTVATTSSTFSLDPLVWQARVAGAEPKRTDGPLLDEKGAADAPLKSDL